MSERDEGSRNGAYPLRRNEETGTMEPNSFMDLGGGVGWFGTLIIGGLAGWIAGKIMKTRMGIVLNIIVGIIGAYIGAFLANLFGLRLHDAFRGWFWGTLIVAAAGPVVLVPAAK